jgi:hypothetical protein
VRKPHQPYDLEIPDDDYKMAWVMKRDKSNFESKNNWVYLGADRRDSSFAKVGITTKGLETRSYSPANPNYYLFCAFQCYYNTTPEQLRHIERGAFNYLDRVFGLDKRGVHTESQRLSECYYGIDFEAFFIHLHDYLWNNHIQHFQSCSYVDNEDSSLVYGSLLSFQFNQLVPPPLRMRYLNMVLKS